MILNSVYNLPPVLHGSVAALCAVHMDSAVRNPSFTSLCDRCPCATATTAAADGVPVFKFKSWRKKGVALPEVLEKYNSVGAELNVLPFCSQFIPMEVINAPKHQSICYHPSLLPRHRGASSINWYGTSTTRLEFM